MIAAGDPNTPRALNYRGYATRKLGRTDEGIGYYLKSVTLDPNCAQVREYLGEAYVIKGNYELPESNCRRSRSFAVRTVSITRISAEALTEAHAL
jgi:Flp pilus assembly protein TadD